jgi:dihydrofolate reductase
VRKLVYLVAATIDGFVAGPDGGDPTSFWPIQPDYIQHLVAEFPETLPGPAREAMGITEEGTHFDTVVEGRKSFEVGLKAGIPDAYPHLRHIVFSRTLGENTDVEVVATDPVTKIQELKKEPGKDIWLVGGAGLAGTLFAEIDRLIVKVGPLTLGNGIPFARREFEITTWQLTGHHVLESGVVFLTYDR